MKFFILPRTLSVPIQQSKPTLHRINFMPRLVQGYSISGLRASANRRRPNNWTEEQCQNLQKLLEFFSFSKLVCGKAHNNL